MGAGGFRIAKVALAALLLVALLLAATSGVAWLIGWAVVAAGAVGVWVLWNASGGAAPPGDRDDPPAS